MLNDIDSATVARFRAGYQEGAPGDCWDWQRSVGGPGYGQIRIRGATVTTHRLAYRLAHGPIPAGFLVCHRCDNKRCVNPAHLFLGTHRDNSRDMISKSRHWLQKNPGAVCGPNNPAARLSPDEVLVIRKAATAGARVRDLARKFGVTDTTVRGILCGRIWKCVALDDAPAHDPETGEVPLLEPGEA